MDLASQPLTFPAMSDTLPIIYVARPAKSVTKTNHFEDKNKYGYHEIEI